MARDVQIISTSLDGTATGETDYRSLSGVTTFVADNETSRIMCDIVPIFQDNVVEGTEVFFVLLNSNDPSVIVAQENASLEILDDTSECTVI